LLFRSSPMMILLEHDPVRWMIRLPVVKSTDSPFDPTSFARFGTLRKDFILGHESVSNACPALRRQNTRQIGLTLVDLSFGRVETQVAHVQRRRVGQLIPLVFPANLRLGSRFSRVPITVEFQLKLELTLFLLSL
jgi:hypothetical protein